MMPAAPGPRVAVMDGVDRIRDVRIPMRDGIRLTADLYLAASPPDGPMPVVVDYIPYRKDEVDITSFRHYTTLARHGYGVCRIDIRGTGGSEGRAVDEYVLQEQLDGYDAVEWLAAQPWCDGHVHLMGISYGGFTALQVAVHQPPHLTSIVPIDVTDDRWTDDCHYRGGLPRMYYDLGWYGTRMVAWNAMPPSPSADLSPAARAATWQEHLEHDEPYLLAWLRHQVDGPYWRQGSVAGSLDRIVCPTFLIGGWRDGYANPPLRLFAGLRGPRKLLIGPWDHALPDAAIPGPRIDYLREIVRWLDHWSRGVDTGIMDEAPIAAYVQEAGSLDPGRLDTPGAWRSEADWPAPGATTGVLRLGDLGTLGRDDLPGGRIATACARTDAGVGTLAGLWSGGVPFGLPGDQRADEAPGLTWTSEPLPAPLTILGQPRAVLAAVTSAPVATLAVSLADVDEDGRSHPVAKGLTTVRGPASPPSGGPAGVGEDVALDLDATAWRFRAGHRIRLTVAGGDWPNVWPTPHAGTIEVTHGAGSPSRLELPVVPDEGSAARPSFEPSAVEVRPPGARALRPTWQIATDLATGRRTVTIRSSASFRGVAGTLVERKSGCVCEVDPADPAQAVVRGWHRCRSTTDDGWTEARADTELRSDATTFRLTIDLEVQVDGAIHHSRRWDETFPRAVR